MVTTTLKAEQHERQRIIETMEEEQMIQFLATPKHYDLYYLTESGEVYSAMAVTKDSEIVTAVVTKQEYRGQGHATKLIEQYAELEGKETIKVNGYLEEAEEFFKQLDVEVTTG